MSETVVWEGDSAVTIQSIWSFEGTSDPEETQDRWTEITIHALPAPTQAFVVFITGRSAIEGETDRHSILYCPTPEDLVKALLRPVRGGGKHLPGYAKDALQKAAEKAPEVRAAVASWDSAARWAR